MEGNFGQGFIRQHDIGAIQKRLDQYFRQDKEQRFELEGVIGSGEFGLTWKLKYKASTGPVASLQPGSTPTSVPGTSGPPQPSFRYIVLKTDYGQPNFKDDVDIDQPQDDDDTNYDSTFPNEAAMLKVLQWAKHIATGVEIPNDPLTQTFPGTPWHRMRRNTWLYTEWIENGTVGKLARRANDQQIRLPNRLLWSFFMCLVRMVIAMGWPPKRPDGQDPQPVIEEINGPPYGALVHRDLFLDDFSVGNIMVGDLLPEDPESEHMLAPILILIDLAEMEKYGDDEKANRRAICYNLRDIACVMILFIALDHDTAVLMSINTQTSKYFQESPTSPRFLTYAHILIDEENGNRPFPWLDGRLRALVCACLAVKDEEKPEPQALLDITKTCLRDRGEQYYASQPGYDGTSESDERIRSILSALILDA
ncbi:hypothetical protein F4859DRAFT_517647 [Xylaria cf. heliscus]|nr:hypothetical protein F4859DRAFT_517647 [Xylaria cf. heliscus]